MGKVNALYQQERQNKFDALVKQFCSDGYSREEAEEMATRGSRQEDRDNGQFGVGT